MINLISHSKSFSSNYMFTDYFPNQKHYLAFFTHNLEESEFLESVNNHILERVISLHLELKSEDEIQEILKKFFVELNWQINAMFRRYDTYEDGISIIFFICYDKSMYFVQFGRLLCGKITENDVKPYGRSWDNFGIKTKEQLQLLGSQQADVAVKVHKVDMELGDILFVLPSTEMEKINKKNLKKWSFNENIQKINNKKPTVFCLFERQKLFVRPKKSLFRGKKARFTAIIMLVIIAAATSYVFLGHNKLEDQLNIQREILDKQIRNIDLEKIQKSLQLEYGLLLIPARNIQISREWSGDISFPVTYKPIFDLKNIFLVSNQKIMAYDKKTNKKLWFFEVENPISHCELLDGNLILLITEDNISYCLKRDSGKEVWRIDKIADLVYDSKQTNGLIPSQISIDQDRRLNSAVIMYPSNKNIKLLHNVTGNILTTYQSKGVIRFVSDYDVTEKIMFVIEDEKLVKLKLDIEY